MQGTSPTFASPLVTQARARPHHSALRQDGRAPLTFAAWRQAAEAWGATLVASGVRAGERVAVFGANDAAQAVAMVALLSIGAVPSPQPSGETREGTIARLRAVEPRHVWLPRAPAPAVGEAVAALGLPTLAEPLDAGGPPPSAARAPGPAAPGPAAAAGWCLSAPWAVLCSSGTTGAPKAVSLAGQQFVGNAFAVASRLGSLPDDVWLGALPWHHVGGLMVLFRALLLGTAVHLCQPFDAQAVVRALDAHALSLVPLVPTMLSRLLDARPAGPLPGRVRAIVLGGAPTPPALLERARAQAWPVMPSYGMTETASQVATAWPYAAGEANDVGPALPGVSVEANVAGALEVRGWMAGGTVVTRDAGSLAADGRLRLHGRLDDLIISGGENVAPEPIEAALAEHEAIAEAAVVAMPDPLWGQRPVAFVRLAPHLEAAGKRPDDAALAAFCRARLASFQRPVQFVWVALLPRDALGKLRRQVLRQRVATWPSPLRASKGP